MAADIKTRMERGRQVRAKLFGTDDTVEWERKNNEFDTEFNEFMLAHRWGNITARPGIDEKTRQLCAFTTFLTLAYVEENICEKHMRAALNVGATPQEIVEIILQTAMYAGLYKTKFRHRAMKVFKELGYEQGVDWGAPLPEDF